MDRTICAPGMSPREAVRARSQRSRTLPGFVAAGAGGGLSVSRGVVLGCVVNGCFGVFMQGTLRGRPQDSQPARNRLLFDNVEEVE